MPNATIAPEALSSAQRQVERVSDHRRNDRGRRLSATGAQHRLGEVGADDAALKSRPRGELRRDVERSSAQIDVRATWRALPVQRSNRAASPRLVDVETEKMVEEIVPRRDLREDPLHVRALGISSSGRCLRLGRL